MRSSDRITSKSRNIQDIPIHLEIELVLIWYTFTVFNDFLKILNEQNFVKFKKIRIISKRRKIHHKIFILDILDILEFLHFHI